MENLIISLIKYFINNNSNLKIETIYSEEENDEIEI